MPGSYQNIAEILQVAVYVNDDCNAAKQSLLMRRISASGMTRRAGTLESACSYGKTDCNISSTGDDVVNAAFFFCVRAEVSDGDANLFLLWGTRGFGDAARGGACVF